MEKLRVRSVPLELVEEMREDLGAPWPEKHGDFYFVTVAEFDAWRAARESDR